MTTFSTKIYIYESYIYIIYMSHIYTCVHDISLYKICTIKIFQKIPFPGFNYMHNNYDMYIMSSVQKGFAPSIHIASV